jgi:beta-N-acetylhexosaminidase
MDTGGRRRMARVSGAAALLLVLTACTTDSPSAGTRPSATPSPSPGDRPGSASAEPTRPLGEAPTSPARPTRSATGTVAPSDAGPPTAHDIALRTLGRLSLDQRVGQLLMVGVPATGPSPTVLEQLAEHHVGNLMLAGRSPGSVDATAALVHAAAGRLTGTATSGVPLLLATDQEGGLVQVLSGSGFDHIPDALSQGGWPAPELRSRARRWGAQLHAAGVNLDLAPVADIVPTRPDPSLNGPIGHFDRQLGSTAAGVEAHAAAFACGMSDAGVATAVKHFPGLGHVRGNTDTSSGVVDHVVGPDDVGLEVFSRAAAACGSVVMTSTAVYARIDPRLPASFSPVVIRHLLRRDLGFRGVVVSDDLGTARQVRQWTPGERARMFVAAGGDLVLTVEPGDVPQMTATLVQAARGSVTMRDRIRESALRVLTLKARLGLLS